MRVRGHACVSPGQAEHMSRHVMYSVWPCPDRCSAFDSSMDALKAATIRVVAIIAEGVPEKDTKQLIAYARMHNKVIIGPATVGGVQVRRD